MEKCFICGATHTSENRISFHRFPKDRRLMNVWIATLDLSEEQVKKLCIETVICSMHFKESDFFETPCGQRCLKPGTVPIFSMESDKQEEVDENQRKDLTLDEKFDYLELEDFRGDREKARQCWNIVELTMHNNKKRLRTMHQNNRRLRARLHKLSDIWKQLENQNDD